jgi:hypothetical protein
MMVARGFMNWKCFEVRNAVASQQRRHTRESGYPVRRGFTVLSLASLEYWIIRFRG